MRIRSKLLAAAACAFLAASSPARADDCDSLKAELVKETAIKDDVAKELAKAESTIASEKNHILKLEALEANATAGTAVIRGTIQAHQEKLSFESVVARRLKDRISSKEARLQDIRLTMALIECKEAAPTQSAQPAKPDDSPRTASATPASPSPAPSPSQPQYPPDMQKLIDLLSDDFRQQLNEERVKDPEKYNKRIERMRESAKLPPLPPGSPGLAPVPGSVPGPQPSPQPPAQRTATAPTSPPSTTPATPAAAPAVDPRSFICQTEGNNAAAYLQCETAAGVGCQISQARAQQELERLKRNDPNVRCRVVNLPFVTCDQRIAEIARQRADIDRMNASREERGQRMRDLTTLAGSAGASGCPTDRVDQAMAGTSPPTALRSRIMPVLLPPPVVHVAPVALLPPPVMPMTHVAAAPHAVPQPPQPPTAHVVPVPPKEKKQVTQKPHQPAQQRHIDQAQAQQDAAATAALINIIAGVAAGAAMSSPRGPTYQGPSGHHVAPARRGH